MLDSRVVRFNASEAWVLTTGPDGGPERWLEADLLDVFNNASLVGENEFFELFGTNFPALPDEAFARADVWCSDPTVVR